MWKRIRTAGSRPFINPVCRNVESGRQLLDAQAPEFAAGVWAHGSPGHGEDFERLAVQRRAKGPVRAEIEFIRDTVALPTSRFCAGVLPRKLCKSGRRERAACLRAAQHTGHVRRYISFF
jgi:hypothetical protein